MDYENPPDECLWFARIQTSYPSPYDTAHNQYLHRQHDFIAKDLAHTIRVWFEWWPELTTNALREGLANIAYDLSLLAQQRFAQ